MGRYDYVQAHPPLKPHLHKDIFEVCFLANGAQTYVAGTTRYNLAGGDLFITKPGEIHSTGREPQNKGRLYWIQFRFTAEGQSFLGLTPQEAHTLMRRFLSLPTRHFRNGNLLAPTFDRILAAYADTHNPLRAVDVRNLLLRLALDIIGIAERRIARPYSIGIQNAIHHIEQHPTQFPDLKVLAHAAHMSDSYFKRIFKHETGMPPLEYAMWRRMENAKHLLRTTNYPVTRLAMEMGFATSQHFATVFKRLTGFTPSAFRQRAHLRIRHQSPSNGAGPGFHPTEP